MTDHATSALMMRQEAAILEARSDIDVVTLPGGYHDGTTLHNTAVVVEMRLRQEDIVGKDELSWATRMDLILADCVVKLGTLPPESIPEAVQNLYTCDRDLLMFALRRRSLGDHMPLRETCPRKSCGKEDLHVIDLREMKITPVPSPGQKLFEYTLPSGKRAALRPMTGKEEHIRDKMANGQTLGAFSIAMFARIALINGQVPSVHQILDIPSRDRDFIRAQLPLIDGSFENVVDLECKHCGHKFSRTIVPTTSGFFFPSELLAAWKRRSSS